MDGSTHPMPMYLRTTAEPLKGSTRLANDIMRYPGPLQNRIGGTKRAADVPGDRTFMVQATLMLGFSAGALTLPPPGSDGRPDLGAMPAIELGWLTHDADRVRLRDATRLALQLAESPAMSRVLEGPINPAEDVVNGRSPDDAIDAWVAKHVVSSQHASSTCRMGADGEIGRAHV